MFKPTVKGTKHEDFVSAKKLLIVEAANKELSAPVRATYAFGQKIGNTQYEVKKKK